MVESLLRIDVTPSFLTCIARVEDFLEKADAGAAYERLLDELIDVVIPNLHAFPLIGRLYLSTPQQSTEALMAIARLPRDAASRLRQYVHGDYLILYIVDPDAIHLVSIRHHREAAFSGIDQGNE